MLSYFFCQPIMVGLLIPLAKVQTYFHSTKYLCEKNEKIDIVICHGPRGML